MVNSSDPSTAGGTSPFRVHPLVGLSTEELRQYVLDYTNRFYPSRRGTPQIVLFRSPVTNVELRDLRLPTVTFGGEAPPLTLAILRGDFAIIAQPGMATLDPSVRPTQSNYLLFVFDTWAGFPTLRGISPIGQGLRTALNAPSLPVTSTDINEPPPLPLPPTGPVRKYGTVVRGYPRVPPGERKQCREKRRSNRRG